MGSILLRGGTIFDGHTLSPEPRDLLIKDNVVCRIAENIDAEADELFDARGTLVTPGLVDLHTHLYFGGDHWGVDPRDSSVDGGVTTLVDAGSAGAGNFLSFKEQIIDHCQRRVKAFLNVAYKGVGISLPRSVAIGELEDLRYAIPEEAARVAKAFPNTIVGIKVRASRQSSGTHGAEVVRLAVYAATEAGKPLMVHIGPPPPLIEDIVPLLRKGDILTHVCRGSPNSGVRNGGVIAALLEARRKGILLDLGHGMASFAFEAAQRMIEQDLKPDILSTDLHQRCIAGPVYDLTTTMSKMMSVGMELEAVLRASTSAPASVLGCPNVSGLLEEGAPGDVSVLGIQKGRFEFRDCHERTLVGSTRLVPLMAIVEGRMVGDECSDASP